MHPSLLSSTSSRALLAAVLISLRWRGRRRPALDNCGVIQGTGATGTNDGVANTADGIAVGDGLILNRAGALIEAFDTLQARSATRRRIERIATTHQNIKSIKCID